MTDVIPEGHFCLTPGVRLIRNDEGGVVLQLSPLRVLRVNGMAFDILERCREGLSSTECTANISSRQPKAILSFLDSLCAIHLLQWKPAAAESLPFVSIVIPVYNRAEEIGECLESLLHLNYPPARFEIIVVDDASVDDTVAVVRGYGVKLLIQGRNLGQSAARNAGVAAAAGDIVAFIDSDCIAGPNWLRELTPYFQDPRIALVGGYVASHFQKTWLDRYEDARSPLNMGRHAVSCNSTDSDFYVPTCNMLVRKEAYLETGGLDESWRVGEDVDLCWKLKKLKHRLIYVPEGKVAHKHRNRFVQTFKRRFDYGTSEPVLYDRHREVAKRFPWQPSALLFCLSCCLGLLTGSLLFAVSAVSIVVAEAFHNRAKIRKKTNAPLVFGEVFKATFKNCYSLAYYLSSHLVRYYLLLMIPLAFLFPSAVMLWLGILLFPVTVDFVRIRPRLPFLLFLFFFMMEQTFYQVGVFVSCMKICSFRCYRLRFAGTGTVRGLVARISRTMKDVLGRRWSRRDPLRQDS